MPKERRKKGKKERRIEFTEKLKETHFRSSTFVRRVDKN
jgi:hypothetical protein